MELTFAKSIRFGALRFNISGSGIGVSAGIPGFRIGTGPRGAYIWWRLRRLQAPAKPGRTKSARGTGKRPADHRRQYCAACATNGPVR